MASVSFSPKARLDLIDIGDYIARDSRASARRFIARLQAGAGRSDMRHSAIQAAKIWRPVWMAPPGRYVIFFRVLDDMVRVERVLHGARNLPVVLARGES